MERLRCIIAEVRARMRYLCRVTRYVMECMCMEVRRNAAARCAPPAVQLKAWPLAQPSSKQGVRRGPAPCYAAPALPGSKQGVRWGLSKSM